MQQKIPAFVNGVVNKESWSINSKMPERHNVFDNRKNSVANPQNIQHLIMTSSELIQKNKTFLGPLARSFK